jgi:fructokinase
MKERPLVAGIGEILWDVLPSGKQLGGAPCNFSFHAKQAGCDSFIISAIGRDEKGVEIKKVLTELGLNDKYVQENGYPTSTVTVELKENGHPDYIIHENVAWDHLSWIKDMEELAKDLDAVCFGTLAQRNPESQQVIKSFLTATSSSCLKVFDINLRQHYYSKELILNSLNLSDVLKLNEDELPVVAGFFGFSGPPEKQLEQILQHFRLKYIVYTLGEKGSQIISGTESTICEVPQIVIADTVGAGDTFTAVFIAGILKGISLKEIHHKATASAAYVCTQRGAMPKIEWNIF